MDAPICLMVGSFFGFLREWMGLEKLLVTFYDDPALIEDMMDQMLYLKLSISSSLSLGGVNSVFTNSPIYKAISMPGIIGTISGYLYSVSFKIW